MDDPAKIEIILYLADKFGDIIKSNVPAGEGRTEYKLLAHIYAQCARVRSKCLLTTEDIINEKEVDKWIGETVNLVYDEGIYEYDLEDMLGRCYLERIKRFSKEEILDNNINSIIKNVEEAIAHFNNTIWYGSASYTVEMFMEQIIENFRGFEKDFMKADDDVHYKNPQFVRLKEISGRYGTNFRQFYRDIDKARRNGERSRKRESDITTEGYEENQKIRIHLITATRSKGKEFDAVIILDADMDEWPNQLSTDIEEERRLFYVAMTRAKQYLYFVITDKSTSSRFLLEAKLI